MLSFYLYKKKQDDQNLMPDVWTEEIQTNKIIKLKTIILKKLIKFN